LERSKLAKRLRWLAFALIVAAVYFYGLGNMPFVGPDEARYAQVAREMYVRGDFVTPTLGGHTWFEKPILLYWLAMAGYALFGVSEAAARAGVSLFCVLTVIIVGLLGTRIERAARDQSLSSFGLIAAAALASSVGLIVFSHGVNFDAVVTMPIAAACAAFFIAEIEADARRKNFWLAVFYAAMGAGLLAKGLIGVVLPAGIIIAYFLLRRAWPERALLRTLWWGWLLTVVVASVWYVPVVWLHGSEFIREFFIQHHFARFVSNRFHHPQPIYYYVLNLAWISLPWTCFLAASLWSARRWTWRADDVLSKYRVFAFAWLIVPVTFFSLSESKLPGYILPALPGAMLLVGEQLTLFVNRQIDRRWAMRASGAAALVVFAAGVIYAVMMNATDRVVVWTMLAIAFAVGAFLIIKPNARRAAIIIMAGAVFSIILLLVHAVAPLVAGNHTARDLIQIANERGFRLAPIIHFHTIEHTAEFYAEGRTLRDENEEPLKFDGRCEIETAIQRIGGTILVFTLAKHLPELTENPTLETNVIGERGEIALVAARAK
jgi:4-amino-4-deoxy-L-arabinose transferase-like glycosyltransferase